jgi:DNA polymerase III epsilon subunit family exonuclease
MQRPRNLISDSSLVQETFDLVRTSGGRTSFAAIADSVFRLANVTEDLAASLVTDLLQNDPRFSIEGNSLAIKDHRVEDLPLKDLDFVVVDVEAIGSRSIPSRVIEIGAYRIRRGEVTDEFQTLVNPDLPLPRFVSVLTGITDEMVASAPRFYEVAESWLDFAGDSVLVAHNSIFDITLLNEEIARVYPGCKMANAEVCTVKLSRRLAPFLDNHNLDALAEHYGFEIPQRHRAAADALATARVLLQLLDELDINGVRTLADARVFRRTDDKQIELELTLDS